MSKKAKAATEKAADQDKVLELNYQLSELPSSQHRAGLAGLVLMVKWLARLNSNQGICELTRVDALGATLRIDEKGLAALFDEVYGASAVEQETNQLRKNRQKEIVPPIREFIKEEVDEKGKTKSKTVYFYPATIPKGAFLLDYEPGNDGNNGLWIKLWRDMVWSILRGVPATREPFESRADGLISKDVNTTWQSLLKPEDYAVDLPSTYFIGAQAKNADDVPFYDRARYLFLLHFWPFVTQIYTPAIIDNEGKRNFVGYALAIPDIANLKLFCDLLPRVLKNSRDVKASGYRPRDAVIDLAVESALDLFKRLKEQLQTIEGEKSISRLILGIDVVHLNKEGNNIRLLGSSRIDPEDEMINEYKVLKNSLWHATFRRQRLINLVNHRQWFAGFDTLLSTSSVELTFADKLFRHDARASFPVDDNNQEESQNYMNDQNNDTNQAIATAKPPRDYQTLIYNLVDNYIRQKLSNKYKLEWDKNANEAKKKEYGEYREKIAKEAFYAVRSRTGFDFIEYFTSTLCSVPQHMKEVEYTALADALHKKTDEVRTLTMLALSARS